MRAITNLRPPLGDAARALRETRVGEDVTAGDARLRVAQLPLARRAAEGPRQALRVVADRRVRLRLRDRERVLDAAEARPGGPALLFAPEVDEARELQLDAGGASVPVTLRPPRRWRVDLVHFSHLDIGYTDPQDVVLAQHARYLDAAVELASETRGWDDDARFRWNVEATLPLERWLATRPAAARRRLVELAREGAIEVTALPFSMHTEAYSIDELARLLRGTDRLRREHGLPITTAMQTDVPGATLALGELLTGAGVDALAVAHNYAGRSVPYRLGGQRLPRPFRWRGRQGRELLVWHTDTLHGSAYMEGVTLGLIDSYEKVAELLPEYLAALGTRGYPYAGAGEGWLSIPPDLAATRPPSPFDVLHLRLTGEHADNGPANLLPAEIVRRWNREWAYPRLRMATNRDFFDTVRAELADRLDVLEGDWTDWWADGIGSAARELGMNRDAQARAPVAQTLHALADTVEPMPSWRAELDACYRDMALFDEHTWGASNPWDDRDDGATSGRLQWQRKAGFALGAHDAAARLAEEGAVRLGHALAGETPAVAVFNPTAAARTDVARAFLPAERVRGPVRVVEEATGAEVPFELEEEPRPRFRARGRHLSFVARDVPGLGYRRYLVRAGAEPAGARADPGPIANARLRLEVDPRDGTVASLVDLALGRELVERGSPFGFNQYVYDRYATAPRFNHLSSRVPEQDGVPWLLGSRSLARDASSPVFARTAAGERVTVRRQGEGAAWIETTYRMWHGLGRVDVENRLLKLSTEEKESVWFAFPFRLRDPDIHWETTGGLDGASMTRLPGSASHMRAIRHWVGLRDGLEGPRGEGATRVGWATAEAPLVQIGMMHVPYAPFQDSFDAAPCDAGSVFSWAMNNVWDTNFPAAQGGETRFRYAVGTGDGAGIELGDAFARPLVATLCPEGGDMPPAGAFVEVDAPGVRVATIAPAREGRGLALLLHSLGEEPVDARVRFPLLDVAEAWFGDHLEREGEPVPLTAGEARVRIAPGDYRALVVTPR